MNKADLLAYADANLTARATVPETFYVPPYYINPSASELAKAASEQDTYNVAAFARAYLYTNDTKYTDAITSILDNWTIGCTSVLTKDDTPLVACYHWYKVFEAVTLIAKVNRNLASRLWARLVVLSSADLLPAFQSISGNFNNWQSWSILAQASLVKMEASIGAASSVNTTTLKSQISRHLTRSTINFPLINRANEFWTENVRGNNALYYTLFSLGPLLLADHALAGGENFAPYVDAFAGNCRNPSQYFARYGASSWLGHVTKLFAPSGAIPELPDADSWSGRFFFYLAKIGSANFTDLYNPAGTFTLGIGNELLYFVENDAELGVLS